MSPWKQPPIKYRFIKGFSGNPKGRPPKIKQDALELIISLIKILVLAINNNKNAIMKIKRIKRILDEK